MPRTKRLQVRIRPLIVFALFPVVWFGLTIMPGIPLGGSAASAQTTAVYRTYGMNFSPYVDGQDPNQGAVVSENQLRARMQIIANHTRWVRSFGCTNGLEKFGMVAHSFGLKAAVGAWLSRDLSANEREISNLISAAQAGQVDLAIVGSEVLLRRDLTESQLIGYLNRVKQQIPAGIPVTTADVYGELLAHPSIIANSDVVFANYYPFWEGISIHIAIATIHRWHQQVVAAAGGKNVIVSETGWPSAGNSVGSATPSPQNASFYFMNFVSWARANNVPYFYFAALDESWKANYEGPQGAHWGVWDKNGVLKPGMQNVFDGQTIPDNWSGGGIPGGAGNPSIEFTYVPPYGSSNNLIGQVLHVKPDDYRIAVYIYVGGWWTKPTFSAPLTSIRVDGSWECDITTGGADQTATKIVAYLVPKDFSPPSMSGGQTLPATLDQNAVAKAEVSRPSNLYHIEGRVTDANNHGLNGVTISLTGSQTATTRTVSNGIYSFINLQPGGNYTITPSHIDYAFNPSSLTFNNLSNSQSGNFVVAPTPITVQLSSANYSGNEGDGRAIIIVTRAGDTSGAATVDYATADNSGLNACHSITGMASSRCDYATTVGTLRFAVGENSKTILIPIVDDALVEGTESFAITLSNPTGANPGSISTATITLIDNDTTQASGNPIDAVPFFVRQHYIDFLGREPEPDGYAGWQSILNNCGTTIAPPCDRIEVSSAFFRSAEFQDRGYFIYRFYSASLGRIPRYSEFMPDIAKVSGFLSSSQLEANKVAFINEFMNRQEFRTKYDGTLSNPSAYVNALVNTAGVNLPQKQALIDDLAVGRKTRAEVLRAIVESVEVYQKFYSESFVVMQYFGYLRRDPDILYLEWIKTMNQTGGDYRIMINGFMNSLEYRQRFGP